MKHSSAFLLIAIFIGTFLSALPGCVDSTEGEEEDEDAPQLTSSHDGWQNPQCNDCHGSAHTDGSLPYQCAGCHGSNGAPSRPSTHTGTAPCADCHGTPHGDTGFPDPDACEVCHD
jgi:hypothetical protein